MTGETSFPEFLSAAQTIAEELTAIRINLTRIAKALEDSNTLEANHPSRI